MQRSIYFFKCSAHGLNKHPHPLIYTREVTSEKHKLKWRQLVAILNCPFRIQKGFPEGLYGRISKLLSQYSHNKLPLLVNRDEKIHLVWKELQLLFIIQLFGNWECCVLTLYDNVFQSQTKARVHCFLSLILLVIAAFTGSTLVLLFCMIVLCAGTVVFMALLLFLWDTSLSWSLTQHFQKITLVHSPVTSPSCDFA